MRINQLIIFQQLVLTMASACLALAGEAFSQQNSAKVITYLICFFSIALLGYLFHGIIESRQAQTIMLRWHEQVKKQLDQIKQNPQGYHPNQQQRFLTWLSSEAYSTIELGQRLRHQRCAALASLLFNAVLCSVLLGPLISFLLVMIGLTSLVSSFALKSKLKKLSQLSARAQQRQFNYLKTLWDRALCATPVLFNQALGTASRLYKRRHNIVMQQVRLEQGLAAMPICLCSGLIIFVLCFFAPQNLHELSHWLVILPRLLSLFSQLHSLSLVLAQQENLKQRESRLKNYKNNIDYPITPVALTPLKLYTAYEKQITFIQIHDTKEQNIIINPEAWLKNRNDGRLCLRGPNGCGKSTWLKQLKSHFNDAILLTPHTQLTERSPGLSLGQEQKRQILFALKQDIQLLILDEWDAHLDQETKHELDQYLFKISKKIRVIEARHLDF
jgi:ABC-type bacteriocin/lantibiotic exporter with double-glycine peptidase domain